MFGLLIVLVLPPWGITHIKRLQLVLLVFGMREFLGVKFTGSITRVMLVDVDKSPKPPHQYGNQNMALSVLKYVS